MNRCERVQIEMVEALTAGQTSLSAKADEHLRSCAQCRLEWSEMQSVWQMLGRLPQQEVSGALSRAVRARVLSELPSEADAGRSARRRRLTLVAVLVGAGLSVASALGLWKEVLSRFLHRSGSRA